MSARMPFGKHKGELLDVIPSGYLLWALREVDLDPRLRSAIEDELAGRPPTGRRRRRPDPAGRDPGPELAAVGPVVDRWYSEMIRLFHPDRGGSTEAAAAI